MTTIQQFHREHDRLFGFSLDQPVEFVTLRVTARGLPGNGQGGTPVRASSGRPAEALLGAATRSTSTMPADSCPATSTTGPSWCRARPFDGPAILENVDSTVVIDPGWHARIDDYGNCIAQPVPLT